MSLEAPGLSALAREFLVVLHNQNPHRCLCSICLISEELMSLPFFQRHLPSVSEDQSVSFGKNSN